MVVVNRRLTVIYSGEPYCCDTTTTVGFNSTAHQGLAKVW
jgi:hypothetical protein